MMESIGRRLMKTWVLKGSSWKSQLILCTRCLWRIRSLMLPPLLADWEYHKVCLPNTWVAPRNLPQNEWKLYLRPYVLWVENYAPFLWLDVSNKILCKRDSTRFRAFFGSPSTNIPKSDSYTEMPWVNQAGIRWKEDVLNWGGLLDVRRMNFRSTE